MYMKCVPCRSLRMTPLRKKSHPMSFFSFFGRPEPRCSDRNWDNPPAAQDHERVCGETGAVQTPYIIPHQDLFVSLYIHSSIQVPFARDILCGSEPGVRARNPPRRVGLGLSFGCLAGGLTAGQESGTAPLLALFVEH